MEEDVVVGKEASARGRRSAWSKAVTVSRQKQQQQRHRQQPRQLQKRAPARNGRGTEDSKGDIRETDCHDDDTGSTGEEELLVAARRAATDQAGKKTKRKNTKKNKRHTTLKQFFQAMTPLQRLRFITVCVAAGVKLTAIILAVAL